MNVIEKIFGTYSSKEIKRILPMVDKIEALDSDMQNLSDNELKAKTEEFKLRLSKGETLEDILVEAFAVVREASMRVLSMKHFRVQLIGGIVLHQGRISEMKTGEGKTLVATLPVYLNALSGKGVHVVTVNDYLASRDSQWMGKLYKFLGLTVGLVVPNMSPDQKRAAYMSDITYATNNELGFDYLRDNMCMSMEEMVQRELNYAIVDEIDSILIDEARTPLIISGQADASTDMYTQTDKLVKKLKPRIIVEKDDKVFDEKDEEYDYVVDLKSKSVSLTEAGTKKVEKYFGIENLVDIDNMEISHHVNQALKAHSIMKNDIDYINKNGEILIVDEFTGRIMEGRRYSDGLHQAIEAKEGVKIAHESKTLGTITFQNYFRLYSKLSGMTGTAKTEESEFKGIYGLDVVEIPTNQTMIRIDNNDVVYKTEKGKFNAIVQEVKASYEKGQPVLVGTVSIENSEKLSNLLNRTGVPHVVLNAKHHEKEAEIVAEAGRYKAVTIATNMAGRGTDIVLGGNLEFLAKKELDKKGYDKNSIDIAMSKMPVDDEEILKIREEFKELAKKIKVEIDKDREKVIEAGGLKIIGSERHESRRIDNQLRGRSGRQGDKGETRFYISLEDDLMKLFGSDKIMAIAEMMGLPEDMPIEQRMLTGAIETAQKKVEGRNYSIRKNVLEYDDVMNKQREIIYKQRRQILTSNTIEDSVVKMMSSDITNVLNVYLSNDEGLEEIDYDALNTAINSIIGNHNIIDKQKYIGMSEDEITEKIIEDSKSAYNNRVDKFKNTNMLETYRNIEKYLMLKIVDEKWMDHIDNMSHLKEGIYLRAYGQSNPLDAYKIESFELFEDMSEEIKLDSIKAIFTVEFTGEVVNKSSVLDGQIYNKENVNVYGNDSKKKVVTNIGETKQPIKVEKVAGRNEPCPCGSGKKYKHCCGKEV